MTVSDYYRKVFGNTKNQYQKISENIDRSIGYILESIPEKIKIKKLSDEGFWEDLSVTSILEFQDGDNSRWVDYEEYTILSLFFSGKNPSDNLGFFVVKEGKEFPAWQYFSNFSGMAKLLKSSLFLDFNTTVEMVSDIISLPDIFVKKMDLKQIPDLSDKRAMEHRLGDLNKSLNIAYSEYEVLNNKYGEIEESISGIDKTIVELNNILFEVQGDSDPEITEESKDSTAEKVKKLTKLLKSIEKSYERIKEKKVKELSREVPRDRVLQSLDNLHKQREKLSNKVKNKRGYYLSQYQDMEKYSWVDNLDSEAISSYKNRLKTMQMQRNRLGEDKEQLYEKIREYKQLISSLEDEVKGVEESISRERVMVDLSALSADNSLELDSPITIGERSFRYLVGYATFLDNSKFLDVKRRREVLCSFIGSTRISSFAMNLTGEGFINIQGENS